MKIRITAKPGEQAEVERVVDVLEKARHADEPVELLIPALKDSHKRATMHADHIRAIMRARLRRVLAAD